MTVHVGVVARCLNTEHIRGSRPLASGSTAATARRTPAFTWTCSATTKTSRCRVPAALASGVNVFPSAATASSSGNSWPAASCRAAAEVIHCTEGSLCWWQPVPTVVTLHDTLAWEERSDTVKDRLYWDHLQSRRPCGAAQPSSPSASRRAATSRRAGPRWRTRSPSSPTGRRRVPGPADDPTPSELQKGLGDTPYAVYLGGPLPRKRFEWAGARIARQRVAPVAPCCLWLWRQGCRGDAPGDAA